MKLEKWDLRCVWEGRGVRGRGGVCLEGSMGAAGSHQASRCALSPGCSPATKMAGKEMRCGWLCKCYRAAALTNAGSVCLAFA